jgi:glutamate synthase domain-containing protein 1
MPVRSLQAGGTNAVIGTNRTVGGYQVIEHRAARNLDRETRAVVSMTHRGANGANGNRGRGVIDIDLQVSRLVLRAGVLGAADIHGLLVPGGHFHGAVKTLYRQPAAGIHRITKMKIFVVPFETAKVLELAPGQQNQSRRNSRYQKLRTHKIGPRPE